MINDNRSLLIRETHSLRERLIPSGGFVFTDKVDLRQDGVIGAQAIYVNCSGTGKLTIKYETDPGRDNGVEEPEDWYTPAYRNPIVTNIDTGKTAWPLSIVIGMFLHFKLEASGGDVLIHSFKLDSL